MSGEGGGPVILVVDDSATSRLVIENVLMRAGYRVSTCINASNALRFVASNHVDLVISDLNMPHMDGFELKYEMDRTRATPMPFVMATAEVTAENRETARKLGSAGFLAKPITAEALLQTVSAALGATRSK